MFLLCSISSGPASRVRIRPSPRGARELRRALPQPKFVDARQTAVELPRTGVSYLGAVVHPHLDVLIVDDNEIVAQAIADGVRLAGYDVCGVASTVEHAVALMRNGRARLALVDVDLGGGDDGIEAARQLLAIGPVTIIFVTGYPDRIRQTDVGMAWLEKPYRVLDLINALEIVSPVSEHRPVTVPVPAVRHQFPRG